ncbi:hypothetical protein GCM10012289_58420 [Nonomuraea cavernae]|uniref:Uncharacterized protein n=1 Tax=Nonomuraea cavernae TaxID=2045107 RepID=A0A917Z870_9ACTN|nr:hypothetical protein GCM10012289_58420 [Nonomuraea cavernae]
MRVDQNGLQAMSIELQKVADLLEEFIPRILVSVHARPLGDQEAPGAEFDQEYEALLKEAGPAYESLPKTLNMIADGVSFSSRNHARAERAAEAGVPSPSQEV